MKITVSRLPNKEMSFLIMGRYNVVDAKLGVEDESERKGVRK